MLLYRVFPYLSAAAPGSVGSGQYIHKPQGHGRLDNPRHYEVWYLAAEPQGAIGEVFGDHYEWSNSMFLFNRLPGSRRALGTYSVPDETPILDLDDARELVRRGLKPTKVIERNRTASQQWALDVYQEMNHTNGPMWCGVRWWSFQRPHWRVLGLWTVTPRLLQVDELDVNNLYVRDAADSLKKRIV